MSVCPFGKRVVTPGDGTTPPVLLPDTVSVVDKELPGPREGPRGEGCQGPREEGPRGERYRGPREEGPRGEGCRDLEVRGPGVRIVRISRGGVQG